MKTRGFAEPTCLSFRQNFHRKRVARFALEILFFLMEQKQNVPLYRPCTIEDPEEFHDSQCFRSDGDLLEYLNNLVERFKYWVDTRGFPESRAAKTCQWRAEILKGILNKRGVTTPCLYDEVFGFDRAVKRRKLTNGNQEEIRAAERELKEAKARYAAALSRKPPSPLATETEDQTALDAIAAAYEKEELSEEV